MRTAPILLVATILIHLGLPTSALAYKLEMPPEAMGFSGTLSAEVAKAPDKVYGWFEIKVVKVISLADNNKARLRNPAALTNAWKDKYVAVLGVKGMEELKVGDMVTIVAAAHEVHLRATKVTKDKQADDKPDPAKTDKSDKPTKDSPAADPGKATAVGGLVTDKRDDSITVLVDGDDEPTKYAIGSGLDKKSLEAMKTIFTVDRVSLKVATDGDTRRVVAIEKVVGQRGGAISGAVLKVYNNFWVAIKPKDGPPDGFALNWPPEKYKQTGDVLKSLKPGDVVAIRYSTDGERHRIERIEVKPAGK